MTAAKVRARLEAALAADGAPSSDYDLNPGITLPENRLLRPAGVLVGVLDLGGRAHVVLTKRSAALKHHPGQIAFPGGKVDQTDDGPEAAALREAHEEVGLDPQSVDILGTLPSHETVTGFAVTPVISWIRHEFDPLPEAGEVDEVFFAPLDFVLRPENFVTEGRVFQGRRRSYYAVPWGPHYIWGATARMLKALSDRMAL